MNIAFWILVIIAVLAVWGIATASLFSARVGKNVSDLIKGIKSGIDAEWEDEDE